ncbi:MAG TPA: hypothetical protein VMM83_05380 [Longimicrobiales bacterium]|nr:hypothetical protein [Longimicrobiales bacterium]
MTTQRLKEPIGTGDGLAILGMPDGRILRQSAILICVAAMATACATAGNYSVRVPPTDPARWFTRVGVAPVVYGGIPQDSLDAAQLATLRRAIEASLLESGQFLPLTSETDRDHGALMVACVVSAFDRGNRFLRFLVSRVGRARLKVPCRFWDQQLGELHAEAVFEAKVDGGAFGGSADLEQMAAQVADAIGRFLDEAQSR